MAAPLGDLLEARSPQRGEIADVGLLLLFGIGLKLRLRSLAQPTCGAPR